MENPFRYSGVVTGDLFVDRAEEIAALHQAFRAGEHMFLYSPRRYGKTSLILEAFRRLPATEKWVYVDLSRALSLQSMVELLISAVLDGTESPVERARRWGRTFLARLQPRLVLDSTGRIQVELGYSPRLTEPAATWASLTWQVPAQVPSALISAVPSGTPQGMSFRWRFMPRYFSSPRSPFYASNPLITRQSTHEQPDERS